MRELGVDYAQGYHVGRPFPAAELSARLARAAETT
jgi:EAL domain-containing protein (putative c-di-GMP-specific phosphodiesterase class I)